MSLKQIVIIYEKHNHDTIEAMKSALEVHHNAVFINYKSDTFESLFQAYDPSLIMFNDDLMQTGLFVECLTKAKSLMGCSSSRFVLLINSLSSLENELIIDLVDDYIISKTPLKLLQKRVEIQLKLSLNEVELQLLHKANKQKVNTKNIELIGALSRAAEFKDNETGNHVCRMSHYCRTLAKQIGFDVEQQNLILEAARMHDIGKIAIPDKILFKPGKLDEIEWEIMKSHVRIGAEILGEVGDSDLLTIAKTIILSHHERWDGTGYPIGLKGPEIPLCGRIASVADVFDALTTIRPYKKAWGEKETLQYLIDNSGSQFDPYLVEAFICCFNEIKSIKNHYIDEIVSK
ncbi:HD domain-containing protein (plasmid) [Aliivibrio salmonicida]|uniref:HD-GYP domain-containing protein n=1 Tax=Aliivibrio salmonicida TaxID=40269 RepID=UPI000F6F2EA7|nr:HD domain-containing phosphohydrolase [Aliivibrio salmonicida]AZL83481.1 HD domain-containing protein [Aliivibrio salmonicida]